MTLRRTSCALVAVATATYDVARQSSPSSPDALLYPTCETTVPTPNPAGQTGNSIGNTDQFNKILGYVTTDPPENLYKTIQDTRSRWQQAPELPRGVQQDLAARYHQTLSRLVAAWPGAFTGTDLDPDMTAKRMEKLLARVEELAPDRPKAQVQLSPAELLAQQWRERLASNTMTGGRNVETEDSRWRAAEQEEMRRRREEEERRRADAAARQKAEAEAAARRKREEEERRRPLGSAVSAGRGTAPATPRARCP